MRKQGELAKIEEYKHQPVVEVILAPAKAIYPSRPNKKLIMAGFIGHIHETTTTSPSNFPKSPSPTNVSVARADCSMLN